METREVVIYCRVSTQDQNVDQQVKHVQEWCAKQGYIVKDICKDKESGRKPLSERKRFNSLLDRADYSIVIYNLDRLTRNWDDVTFIEKFFRDNWKNTPLISTSDTIDLSNASGRMMFRIKMAVSCMMPEDIQ